MHLDLKKRRLALFPILLTFFLDNFGVSIVYPIFTPLLLESGDSFFHFNVPYFERTILLGFLIGSFPFAQFFSAPLIGQFSDRFGRKKTFCITILGAAIGYTCTAISIMEHSLTGLFISRFCTGIFAGNLSICLAAIADISHDEVTRTKNFGLTMAIGGLSFILAIAVGGILSDPDISALFNPSVPLWITVLLSYLNLACVLVLFRETHPGLKRPGFNPFSGIRNIVLGLKSRELRTIYLVNFLFMLGCNGAIQFFPTILLETYQFSIKGITYALIAVGILWSWSSYYVNKLLAKRFYPGYTLLYTLLLSFLFLIFTIFFNSLTIFLILFYVFVCTASLSRNTGLAVTSLNASSEIQGSALGINQSMNSLALILSPALGGFLIGYSPESLYVCAGFACLFAFLLLLHKKAYARQTSE